LVSLFVGGLGLRHRLVQEGVFGGLEYQTSRVVVPLHQRASWQLASIHPFAMFKTPALIFSEKPLEFGPADGHLDVLVTISINAASTISCRSRQRSRSMSLLALAVIFAKASLAKRIALCAASLAQRCKRSRSCLRATVSRARFMTRVLWACRTSSS